jgi:hypothetical protein
MFKKIIILGTSILLTLGITANSYAYRTWPPKQVQVHCRDGVCDKYAKFRGRACRHGHCRGWHRHFRSNWHR